MARYRIEGLAVGVCGLERWMFVIFFGEVSSED